MSDDYPAEWTPWIKRAEEPLKVNGHRISELRSGCPNTTGLAADDPDAYPQEWVPTHQRRGTS